MSYKQRSPFETPQKPFEEEKPQVQLSDLDKIIKEAQERLGQKKREFEFIAKLDKKQVATYVQGADKGLLQATQKEGAGSPVKGQMFSPLKDQIYSPLKDERFGPNEKLTDWKTLPDLRAPVRDLSKYMETVKDDFYAPITKERIKELHEQLKKGRNKYSLSNIREDDQKLNDKYHSVYSSFLKNQLKEEAERRRRNKDLIDMHEMSMILSQKVDINEPKIWKKDRLEPADAEKVKEAWKDRMRAHEDKSLPFAIQYETDIVRQVDAYLNELYRDVNLEKEVNVIRREKENAPSNTIKNVSASAGLKNVSTVTPLKTVASSAALKK